MSTAAAQSRALFFNCKLGQRPWTVLRCRSSYASQRRQRFHVHGARCSGDNRFRPYYVTSPIFYVNAEPHAGHLYTLLLADVLKRWEVLKGDKRAALLTGTDEHGMKVQKAAEKLKMLPQDMCDQNAAQFLALAEHANISFDRFIRTTDADHKTAVEHFWKELSNREFIYESIHQGWYSVSDETFYPQSQVHLILDPKTGRKIHVSKETGKEVEWTSETNYRFKLSAFQGRLLEHYEQHPEFIVPVQRMNFIKQEVREGLEDLSVSRPSSRLQWGIRVPGDDSQTIYVWLDALINYLTMTGYPSGEGDRHKLWPPNVQVIGKDIVRFHTIYWPAFLMALDVPLPRSFLTHAHWTMGKTKMSKSLGNGVNPFLAIRRYGLDSIRYFMMHDGGIVDDSDYDNAFIVERYKKGLQGGLGNLMSRLLRGKKWSVGTSVKEVTTNLDSTTQSQQVKMMIAVINKTTAAADEAMTLLNPRAALHHIMELIYEGNRFFSDAAPWDLAKESDPAKVHELHHALYATAETLRVACILLQPFMPDKMSEALDQLHVAQDMRGFDQAKFGTDTTYAEQASEDAHRTKRVAHPLKHRERSTLFPPLIAEA